jgi:hypothetical protein
MINLLFLFTAAALTVIWGVAHLFPTKSVVKGFGDITADNKKIITMEWIIEGLALIFIGILVAGVTLLDSQNTISYYVYILSSLMLFVLAIVSLFTGFNINFLPYKLCPVIFSLSAILILSGLYI